MSPPGAPMLQAAIPVLQVAAIERARSFYCGRLGFEQRFAYQPDPARPDPCYIGLVRGRAALHVSSFPGDGVAGAVVVLIVERVDPLHEELSARGVAIELAPTDQSWGNREMYLRDPDGNRLRFVQPGAG
jgi:catechol 2,3-dioxygenase-like lactoylglutathione lyase family enzyme